MNLHGIVRGAITTVNPDRDITWLQSTGDTIETNGKQTPTYASPATISTQIQPLAGDDLRQIEYLNMQGVFRKVYAYGDIEGIVRPELKGGDLLQFAFNGTPRNWLVVHVLETWTPDAVGWCAVIAVLQEGAVT